MYIIVSIFITGIVQLYEKQLYKYIVEETFRSLINYHSIQFMQMHYIMQ